MAGCLYCGKPAGFLKKKHPACAAHYQAGLQLINTTLTQIIEAPTNAQNVALDLSKRVAEYFISDGMLKKLAVKFYASTLDNFLSDDLLDENEEKKLNMLSTHFGLNADMLDQENNASLRTEQAVLLRGITRGELPNFDVKQLGSLPVNLQKSEQIVWAFPNTSYLEDKIRKTYVGGSQGVSVRIAKGVYYRTSSFKGQAVERQERVHIDTGLAIVTNKNIYFVGPKKSLRVPYNKIVSFLPFSDGIGFMKDTQTAKPQVLCTGSGWFAYNLITNLAQMAAA